MKRIGDKHYFICKDCKKKRETILTKTNYKKNEKWWRGITCQDCLPIHHRHSPPLDRPAIDFQRE